MSTQAVFNRGTSTLQRWSPVLYANNARFVGDLAAPVVELLAPLAGERILDIGCGDGYLTEKINASGACVTGVDYSPELVAAARFKGLDVHLENAEALHFQDEFHGIFSNAAMHWMRKADAVAAGAYRALKSGGRFVGEFAGARNAYYIRQAVHESLSRRGIDPDEVDPWYLPTAEEYRDVLEGSGLRPVLVSLFDRPVAIDYPIADWIRTFGSPYLTVLPEQERSEFLAEVSSRLVPHLLGSDGRWIVDYTRLRFKAVKD